VTPESNRRSSERHAVQLEVEVTIAEQLHKAKTRDLSLGGVFIYSKAKPAFNTRVHLRFAIPSQKELIEVGGVVRWDDPGGFGVHFDGLRARDVWALGRFLDRR
jgi:hypothetical protein